MANANQTIVDLANDTSMYLFTDIVYDVDDPIRLSKVSYLDGKGVDSIVSARMIVDNLYDDYYRPFKLSKLAPNQSIGQFRAWIGCDRLGAIIGTVDYYLNIADRRTKRDDHPLYRYFHIDDRCQAISIPDIITTCHRWASGTRPGMSQFHYVGDSTIARMIVELYYVYVENAIDDRFNKAYESLVDTIGSYIIEAQSDNMIAYGIDHELAKFDEPYQFVLDRYHTIHP